jgi:polyribonucleotide nucleotidyltransferase
MDAGVDVGEPVAGVAMGLITGERFPVEDCDDFVVVTDILGAEDYFGSMDCKIAGTERGITAAQLDVKLSAGLPIGVVAKVLDASSHARKEILDEMNACVSSRRDSLPDHAPRTVRIPVDRQLVIKLLLRDRAVGLKDIELRSGARLMLERDSFLRIDARNSESAETAKRLVRQALADIPVGTKLVARVIEAKKTYAILESSEGAIRGMLHASRMNYARVDGVFEGDSNVDAGKENDGIKTNRVGGQRPDPLRFPDVRHRLKEGDVVDVVVVESCRARDVLRFCLVAKRPSSDMNEGVDLYLDQLRGAPSVQQNLPIRQRASSADQ